jgi:asparagine synthetase B (glutamine-hydrolysing)
MPGITGIISDGRSEISALHKSMLECLDHYPYKKASVSEDLVHFGIAHLGFIKKKDSIISSEDKRYLLSFIGEIFSYKSVETHEIDDDQQFFLKTFIKDGPECLKFMNGHYCAALYDFKLEILYLFSDRMGTRPLYYATFNHHFLFASEVKAILKSGITREIDYSSVSELFSFGHLFGHKTMFTGVSQLPEASYIIYSKGKVSIRQYWQLPEFEEAYQTIRPAKKDVQNLTDELSMIISRAMKRNFTKNKDSILLSLSGGLDSRYVAAFAASFGVSPLVSFTMGPDTSADQIYSKIVAHQLGIQHNPFEIKPYRIWEDARKFGYISDYMSPIYGPIQGFEPLESFFGRKKITISSQMCDALFGGNLWRKSIQILINKKRFDPEAREIVINSFKLFSDDDLKMIFTRDFYLVIRDRYMEVPKQYADTTNIPLHAYINLLINEHGRRGTLSGNLMNNLFMETRMPSYDNDVIEFAYKLPLALRENQYLYRHVFTQLFPELSKIKRERYNIAVNASNARYQLSILENKVAAVLKNSRLKPLISWIPKYNRPTYINYDGWFRNELNHQMTEIILDNKTLSRNVFNAEGLRKLIKLHLKLSNNHSRLLWQIINLEYFYRNFID